MQISDQTAAYLGGVARHALTAVGASLATDGILTSAQASQDVGIVMTVLGVGWSMYRKWQLNKAAKALAAASSPGKK